MASFGIGNADALAAEGGRLGLTLAATFEASEAGFAALRRRLASEAEPATVLVESREALDRDRLVTGLVLLEAAGARLLDGAGGDPLAWALGGADEPLAPSERAQHIRSAMARKAMQGLVLGRVPYGYQAGPDGALQEASAEAAIVRQIFQLASEEKGIRAIVKELNAQGLRTRRGGPWSMVTVRDMLRNRVYTGTYRRFGARVAGNHPALVPPRQFREVQERLDARALKAGYAPGSPFLLSGLAVCGACGSRMIGMTRRQTWRRQDGTQVSNVYRYYQCEAATNQGRCTYHTRRAADLEAEVLAGLSPQEMAAAARAALDARLSTLAREAAAGRHTPQALRQAIQPLQQALRQLQESLEGRTPSGLAPMEPPLSGPAEGAVSPSAGPGKGEPEEHGPWRSPTAALLEAAEEPGVRALLREALGNRIEQVVVGEGAAQVALRPLERESL